MDRFRAKLKLPDLKLSAEAIRHLLEYPWPGNVRELENAIEHAAVLTRDGRLTPELLPPGIVHGTVTTRAKGSSLAEMALGHIQEVLQQTGGNRRRAATILGISTATLWRKLKGAPRHRGPVHPSD